MPVQRIVVIGASAGGIVALKALVSRLRSDFPVPVLMAMHVASDHKSLLPSILSRAGDLIAVQAEDGQALAPGRIYVAAPGFHLLAGRERLRVSNGPKENGFRPSVDVLFRSAAYHWGARSIGVVLSGSMDDGSSGLYAIKRMGGIAVVQDPRDAEYSDMPLSALSRASVDHKAAAGEIGALLNEVALQPAGPEPPDAAEYRQHLQVELDISSNDSAFDRALMEYGEPTRYTCPSCSGVLSKIEEGNTHRFRCHTGHGYSLASLLSEHRVHLEDRLWQGLMSLQESISLLNDAAERLRASGDEVGAQDFRAKVEEAKAHADTLRGLTLGEAKLARRVG